MIGLNYLGKRGQLGNQMFQYAALKGIASWKGYEYIFPNHNEVVDDGIGNKLRIELFDAFKVNHSQYGLIRSPRTIQESHFHFDSELFDTCPDDACLVGFFQTPKYFDHIQDQIRKDFEFKDEYVESCKELIDEFDNPVALHIRRGDFLINSGNHYNLSLSYYENALKEFDDDRQVVIFSDDPDWCYEQELFADDRFLISDKDNGAYNDLYMMTQCSDFIIGNSTYSWWGAWLCTNPKKVVLYPDKWFGPNLNNSTEDLFPNDWRMINEN